MFFLSFLEMLHFPLFLPPLREGFSGQSRRTEGPRSSPRGLHVVLSICGDPGWRPHVQLSQQIAMERLFREPSPGSSEVKETDVAPPHGAQSPGRETDSN